MQERWSFPDANEIYSKKLIAERCLLALARHSEAQQLEEADLRALESLRQMLIDAAEINYGSNAASLSADKSTNVKLVVELLVKTKLAKTLPDVKDYLRELMHTVSEIEKSGTIRKKQKNNVVDFVQHLSTDLGSEIVNMSRNQATVMSVI